MSVATDIRDQAVTLVRAAGIISPDLDASNVRHRKVPQRFETDPDPLCLVVPGRDGIRSQNNMERFCFYEMLVVTGRRGALVKAKSDDWLEATRQTIKDTLYVWRLLGDDGVVWKAEYNPSPSFDRKGWPKDFDLSGQMFVYETQEPRLPGGG